MMTKACIRPSPHPAFCLYVAGNEASLYQCPHLSKYLKVLVSAALLKHFMSYAPSPHRDKLYLLNLDLQEEDELVWLTNSSLYNGPSTSTKCQNPGSDVS